jgi:hypothetical protein
MHSCQIKGGSCQVSVDADMTLSSILCHGLQIAPREPGPVQHHVDKQAFAPSCGQVLLASSPVGGSDDRQTIHCNFYYFSGVITHFFHIPHSYVGIRDPESVAVLPLGLKALLAKAEAEHNVGCSYAHYSSLLSINAPGPFLGCARCQASLTQSNH